MIRLDSTQTPPLVQEDGAAVLIIGSRATPAAILILLGLLLSSSSALAQTTTAQQLGYGPNDKVLMVHADDIGMSHSVNVATIEAFKKGLVTSGSVMVPCPWFPEIAAYAREHPELDLGLHLTLTSEWKYLRWRPVASPEKVKGLLDEEGFMWRSERQTATKATPLEVETELRAQIERALQFGLKPTHLDTHMGTLYTRKDFFDVYTKLGKEYGIPVMVMRPTPEIIAYGKQTGLPITEDLLKKQVFYMRKGRRRILHPKRSVYGWSILRKER
jgi:chitin disaccharide deacetylase